MRLGAYEILGPLSANGHPSVHAACLRVRGSDEVVLFAAREHDGLRNAEVACGELRDQARLVEELANETIIPVREVLPGDREVYVISELVAGDSLAHLLEGGAVISKMLAVAIVRDLATILARLHAAGLVHGDVCPSTIMVMPDGQLALREVGVAATVSSYTGPADVRGHLAYMAPERASGRHFDAHADVYSLGLVLWELLTGERAIRGNNALDLRSAAMRPTIEPPSAKGQKTGRELDTIVMHALAADEEERHPTAEAFRRELERYVVSRAPGTNVKLELAKLVTKHVAPKLRAQKLLVDRWVAQGAARRSDSPAPARAPSRGGLVERYASTGRGADARLFSELGQDTQDLVFEAPVEAGRSVLDPPTPIDARRSAQRTPHGHARPDVPTDDLHGAVTGDLPVPRSPSGVLAGRSKGELVQLAVLLTLLAAALSAYFFSEEGQNVLMFWLR
ncbi:serine/threonine protein kinase [Myxococcota bacterium]|nr:serine/threonine protein kinase [Myxococcota bacterium]